MYKITLLSLLLVVGMMANAQKVDLSGFHKVYVNDKGDQLSGCYKFYMWDRKIMAYSECGSNDTIVLDPVGLVRNYLEVEHQALLLSEQVDSLKKLTAKFYQLQGIYPPTYQIIDPKDLPASPHSWNIPWTELTYFADGYDTNMGVHCCIDSCATLCLDMPTQLTIKKKHKRHKWVKKSPPDTKD